MSSLIRGKTRALIEGRFCQRLLSDSHAFDHGLLHDSMSHLMLHDSSPHLAAMMTSLVNDCIADSVWSRVQIMLVEACTVRLISAVQGVCLNSVGCSTVLSMHFKTHERRLQDTLRHLLRFAVLCRRAQALRLLSARASTSALAPSKQGAGPLEVTPYSLVRLMSDAFAVTRAVNLLMQGKDTPSQCQRCVTQTINITLSTLACILPQRLLRVIALGSVQSKNHWKFECRQRLLGVVQFGHGVNSIALMSALSKLSSGKDACWIQTLLQVSLLIVYARKLGMSLFGRVEGMCSILVRCAASEERFRGLALLHSVDYRNMGIGQQDVLYCVFTFFLAVGDLQVQVTTPQSR